MANAIIGLALESVAYNQESTDSSLERQATVVIRPAIEAAILKISLEVAAGRHFWACSWHSMIDLLVP